MPLLNDQHYPKRVDVSTGCPTGSEDTLRVPYTGERFQSKADYDRRMAFFERPQWTCRVSRTADLSYKQAVDSETMHENNLENRFPSLLESTVLEIAHHSTDTEEVLVQKCLRAVSNQYRPGEAVFLLKKPTLLGVVESIYGKAGTNGQKPSPGSDKENAEQGNGNVFYTVIFTMEGAKSTSTPGQSPSNRKTVNNIPHDQLGRKQPVNAELVRHFLRAHTSRGSYKPDSTSPWQVDQQMRRKYSIRDKLASLFTRRDEPATAAKSTPQVTSGKPSVQRAKKSVPKPKPKLLQPNDDTTVTVSSSSSDDEGSAPPRRSSSGMAPSSVTAKKQAKKQLTTPRSLTKAPVVDLTCDDESRIATAVTPDLLRRLSSAGSTGSSSSTAKRKKQLAHLRQSSSVRKNSGNTQASGSQSPNKNAVAAVFTSQAVQNQKRFQLTIDSLKATFKTDPRKFGKHLSVAATLFSEKQIDSIDDDEIRKLTLHRKEQIDEAKRRRLMTDEERAEYDQKKKEKQRELMKQHCMDKAQKQREIVSAARMKFEDLSLGADELPSLPEMELVSQSAVNGSADEVAFGEVVMVLEFIRCYADLLSDDAVEHFGDVSAEDLTNALTSGEAGFGLISKTLLLLLQTLLQDDVATDYSVVGVKLASLPISQYTCGELVRLALRPSNSDEGVDDESQPDGVADDDRPDSPHSWASDRFMDEQKRDVVSKLASCEFYELTPQEQLTILTTLVNRLLSTYAIEDHMAYKSSEQSQAWKNMTSAHKNLQDVMRQQNDLQPDRFAALKTSVLEAQKQNDGTPPPDDRHSDGKEQEADAVEQPSPDLAERMRRRRQETVEEKKRRVEEEKAERERRRKEAERQDAEELKQKADRAYNRARQAFLDVNRVTHLGVDRFHRRYWLFGRSLPGLYVEDGWCRIDDAENISTDDDQESSEYSGPSIEPTFPKTDMPNRWYRLSKVSDFEALEAALARRGIRESQLRLNLTSRRTDIIESLKLAETRSTAEGDEDTMTWTQSISSVNLLDDYKKELIDIEVQLRSGGLGGVTDLDSWAARIDSAGSADVKALAQCLVECYKSVERQFFKGILAGKTAKLDNDSVKQDDEVSGDSPQPTAKHRNRAEVWLDAVEHCKTVSRLRIMLAIFHDAVAWDKSIAHVKCRLCRKKQDDDLLLLCDNTACNAGYHTYCLRPKLKTVPKGTWFCPTCTRSRKNTTSATDGSSGGSKRRARRSEMVTADEDDDVYDDQKDSEQESDVDARPIRARRAKQPPAKKSRRARIDDDESGDDVELDLSTQKRTAKTNANKKMKAAAANTRSTSSEPNSRPSSRGSEGNEVALACTAVLHRLKQSRSSLPLQSMPKVEATVPMTRSGRRPRAGKDASPAAVDLDWSSIERKQKSYNDVGSLFQDVTALLTKAKQYYKDNSRKCTMLETFEELLMELESEYIQ